MNLPKFYQMLASAVLLAGAATSCSQALTSECKSTGPMISRTESVSGPTTSLSTSMGLKVTYTQSDTTSIVINAPSDIMQYIVAEQKDGSLSFSSTKPLNQCAQKVSISVSAPDIVGFRTSSGSSLIVESPYSAGSNDVYIKASSGSLINFQSLNAAKISVESSSGASVNLLEIHATNVSGDASSGSCTSMTGSATTVQFETSSGASISAGKLQAQNGSANASSGSSVTCNITQPDNLKKSSGASINNVR